MAEKKLQIGVLISGNGTNLQVLIDQAASGKLAAEIKVVISSKCGAFGLERAKKSGIPAVFLDRKDFATDQEHNMAILETLQKYSVELVVMAGYMRILGDEVISAYKDKVINLHPSLLPAFAGAPHAIEDAFNAGVKITGVTVHLASKECDRGPIIAQSPVIVVEGDTLESLEARVHEAEYEILPRVIQLFAKGKIEVVENKVKVI